MKNIALVHAWAAIVAVAIITPSAVVAETPTASRIVSVRSTDLMTGASIEKLRKKLRTVSRLVCKEQYPGDSVYIHSHPCAADTFADASRQLDKVIASKPAAPAAASIIVSGR